MIFLYGRKTVKSYPCVNFQKIHHLEGAKYEFLDLSKTSGFRDVSKIEILQVTVLRMLTVRKLCFALVHGALKANLYRENLQTHNL